MKEKLHPEKKHDFSSLSQEEMASFFVQLAADQRFGVAAYVAQGLEYLHTAAQPPVLHRDVKADNILLTEDGMPKVLFPPKTCGFNFVCFG